MNNDQEPTDPTARAYSVIGLVCGTFLMALNHFAIVFTHRNYGAIFFIAPGVILFSIVGLFAPALYDQSVYNTPGGQSVIHKVVVWIIFIVGAGIGWAIGRFSYGVF